MLDKLWMWIAWKLPRQLVMWCAVRLIAQATTGRYGHLLVPDLTALDALKRWQDPSNADNGESVHASNAQG